jgi:hypothetical protein
MLGPAGSCSRSGSRRWRAHGKFRDGGLRELERLSTVCRSCRLKPANPRSRAKRRSTRRTVALSVSELGSLPAIAGPRPKPSVLVGTTLHRWTGFGESRGRARVFQTEVPAMRPHRDDKKRHDVKVSLCGPCCGPCCGLVAPPPTICRGRVPRVSGRKSPQPRTAGDTTRLEKALIA